MSTSTRPSTRRCRCGTTASRASCSTSSRRATAPTARCCVRRAWWSLADMAGREGPLQDARRRQEGLRRRDQEGLPQARAPVPPGHEPRRRAGRGALQGGPGAPTRSCPTRRSASSTTRAAASSAAASPAAASAAAATGRRLRRLRRHHLRPLRRRRGEPGARRGRSAAATSRPTCTCRSSRRWRAARSP